MVLKKRVWMFTVRDIRILTTTNMTTRMSILTITNPATTSIITHTTTNMKTPTHTPTIANDTGTRIFLH
jgi:hypothetical protein